MLHKFGRFVLLGCVASIFLPERESNNRFGHRNIDLLPILLVSLSGNSCATFINIMRNSPRKVATMVVQNSTSPGAQRQNIMKKSCSHLSDKIAEIVHPSSSSHCSFFAKQSFACDQTSDNGREC